MLSDEKLARLNHLSRKSKTSALTEEERNEQKALREEYLANLRKSLRQQLDHIHVVEKDGDVH
jgi:uncharacterized protein YnzC (UPF0291/DUF896 family)